LISNGDDPLVSIIIPCREIDDTTRECIAQCSKLDYQNFEIVLLPDAATSSFSLEGTTVVNAGRVSPGRKRNIGAGIAKGEILAYIDADAYPRKDWLRNAVSHLEKDANIAAVGGPGLTPPEDNGFEQAQGRILSSFLVGGISSRYKGSAPIETDDIHSVNFVAWKKKIVAAGGWNEQYWPGEDTLLCLSLKASGYKQLLAPDVVVYHHRRKTWKGYLEQIWNYGVHRGFFAKHFPANSRRVGYFVPSLLVLGLVFGILLSIVIPAFMDIVLVALIAYLALITIVVLQNLKSAPIILLGLPLTHSTYGIGFIKGLTTRRLSR
jgi:cellulose synthase/poly-beta-1,6-N-acetylglucosamine synthase-like glycosyltransferase